MARPLFKTTIVVWTEFDPGGMEIDDLVTAVDESRGAMGTVRSSKVEDPESDPDWENDPMFDEVYWKN